MLTILTNPANAANLPTLPGVKLVFSPYLNPRQTRTYWIPPDWGPFVELEASDECWARPLGIGALRTLDLGPLYYIVDESKLSPFPR
jgi:hypothetical protein